MTDNTERDALLAEARRWPGADGVHPSAPPIDLIRRLADALEREPVVVDEARTDAVAAAIAKAADADYWTDEIRAWEESEDWEQEAHPDNYPDAAYEDREWYRKQARAALAALTPDGQEGER